MHCGISLGSMIRLSVVAVCEMQSKQVGVNKQRREYWKQFKSDMHAKSCASNVQATSFSCNVKRNLFL